MLLMWNSEIRMLCAGLLFVASLLAVDTRTAVAQQTIAGERLRVVDDAKIGGDTGSPDYISQLTDWLISKDGAADFRYLFTDELHAKTFIADLEQALAGGQVISKSVAVLAANFTNPAPGAAATLTVRDLPSADGMAVFESGDTIKLRSFSRASGSLTIADSIGVVSSYVDQPGGLQNWTFTRNTGSDAGSMSTGTIVQADALVLDYGVSGNGYHEINAIDGLYGVNSPYSQVVTWATSPIAANLTVRSRIGNLRGITGVAGEFGAILGTYAASNGQYIKASNQGVELHGVNLQLWDGATNVIKLDRTVPSFALGSPVPSAYGTGTGCWMGKDGGVYKSRCGVPGGAGFFWDGSTFAINGAVTATSGSFTGSVTASSGSIGGWTIGASTLTGGVTTLSSSGNITVGSGNNVARLSDDATYRMWVGHATASSAPFRVTVGGAVTMTSVDITGGTLDIGPVEITSNGIVVDSGTGTNAGYRFAGGFRMTHDSVESQIQFTVGSVSYEMDNSGFFIAGGLDIGSLGMDVGGNIRASTSGLNIGTSGSRFNHIFLAGDINVTGFPTTTADDYPVVYSTTNTLLYRKTNGVTGTTCAGLGIDSINWDRGIAVSVTCN